MKKLMLVIAMAVVTMSTTSFDVKQNEIGRAHV